MRSEIGKMGAFAAVHYHWGASPASPRLLGEVSLITIIGDLSIA